MIKKFIYLQSRLIAANFWGPGYVSENEECNLVENKITALNIIISETKFSWM